VQVNEVDKDDVSKTAKKQPRRKRGTAASIGEAQRLGPEVSSVRIQLTLRPEYAARLEALRSSTRAASYSDVFRDALNLYEKVHKQVADGGRLLLETPAGERFVILID
jgi:hypothetical protein